MPSNADKLFAMVGSPTLFSQLGEPIVRRPKGSATGQQSLTGIVDLSGEQGTNQKDGDGPNIDSKKGRRVRRSLLLDIPANITVNDLDQFVVRGEVWNFVRVMARDTSIQTLLCDLVAGQTTHQTRTRY